MIYKKINLKEYYSYLQDDVYLTIYCPDNSNEIEIDRKRKTLLVLPGGGYSFCSDRENEPIALRFLGYDFNCFTLVYNCPIKEYPYPAIEAFAALAYIREHAEDYNVDTNKVGVIGFSAGGHLACTISMWSENEEMAKYLNVDKSLLKVNYLISAYSVVTTDIDKTHLGTMQNISKEKEELKEAYAIERHVTKDFPPTYIWATEDDQAVPVINSKLLYKACLEAGVKCKCHIYPHGIHGLSLADRSVYPPQYSDELLDSWKDVKGWVLEAIEFIESL